MFPQCSSASSTAPNHTKEIEIGESDRKDMETYADYKGKVNFTPAPSHVETLSTSKGHQCITTINDKQKEEEAITNTLLTQLVDLIQQ